MTRQKFLTWLFEFCSEGKLETRGLPNTKRTFHELGNWSAVEKWCEKHSDKNLYHAVATRVGGGSKEHISQIPAVWCDLDFKDVERREAHDRINAFPQRPSVIVETGGGYHLYWRLSESATPEDIVQVEALNKQIAAYLGGDAASCDAARILRLPDTLNRKYDPPRKVEVIWSKQYDYNLEDLADEVPSAPSECELQKASTRDKGIYKDILLTNSLYRGDHTDKTTPRPQVTTSDHRVNFDKSRDESVFHIANCLAKGGMAPQDIEKTLFSLLPSLPEKDHPFTKKDVRQKIRSALNRKNRIEKSLSQEIREWVMTTDGHFMTTDVHNDHKLTTRREKKTALMVLLRMEAEGLLEKASDKRGHYRRVHTDFDMVDLQELDLQPPLEIRLPLQAERLGIEIMPKDLIVYAGTPNAGKTALMLETVRLNMNDFDCFYFSSELGRHTAKKRLAKHKECKRWNFKFVDDFPNYLDIIQPDALNFVDYIEVEEGEYYKLPSILGQIQRKLKQGLAFVAMQKNPGTKHALGGVQTKGKPALFLIIEDSKLVIEKAKNYGSLNPNGLSCDLKIVDGINVSGGGTWRNEKEINE